MTRLLVLLALLWPLRAPATCRLCADAGGATTATREDARPLTVEIETTLDFSRAADRGGGGSIAVSERGDRRVTGLVDLGGYALQGRVRVTGAPGAHVRVVLPPVVELRATDGAAAQVVDLRADVGPAPVLDASGTLVFGFGGTLRIAGGQAGDFRGRMPITVDYE